MMLAVQHYERYGYKATAENLAKGRFRPKWSSMGEPRDHSYWRISRPPLEVEAHLNAPVWDGQGGKTATFVVDVGIVSAGSTARRDADRRELRGFENADLRTFIESKSIPIYPMLVAHFLGIVHEITPWAMQATVAPPRRDPADFDPALVSRKLPSANTERLLGSLVGRGVRVRVVPAFDQYVLEGRLRPHTSVSVLARDPVAVWPTVDWGRTRAGGPSPASSSKRFGGRPAGTSGLANSAPEAAPTGS